MLRIFEPWAWRKLLASGVGRVRWVGAIRVAGKLLTPLPVVARGSSADAQVCAVCVVRPQHAQACEMSRCRGATSLGEGSHRVPRRAGWQKRGERGHVIGLVTGQ